MEQVEDENIKEPDCSHHQTVQTVSNTGSTLAATCAPRSDMSEFAANIGKDLSEDERQKFFNLLRKYATIFADIWVGPASLSTASTQEQHH